jgi:hypothetical protein
MEQKSNDLSASETGYSGDCTVVACQAAAVSVPVTVRPNVSTCAVKAFCCGEPALKPSPCTFRNHSGSGDAHCSFILTQNICIEIPIEFSAQALLDAPYIQYGKATDASEYAHDEPSFQKG